MFAFARAVALTTVAGCLLEVPPLENANAEGLWSLVVKNEKDSCGIENWAEGGVNTFEIKIEQFGDRRRELKTDLQGLASLFLWIGIGTATLTGRIDGEAIELSTLGTRDAMLGGCTFRYELLVKAVLKDDRLRFGEIRHIPRQIVGNDCNHLRTCEAKQSFDAVRVDVAAAPL